MDACREIRNYIFCTEIWIHSDGQSDRLWDCCDRRTTFGSQCDLVDACWVVLGLLGASTAEQPLPSDHILMLVEERHLDLHSPLRWHGYLRDEPALLPWGISFEIALSRVDAEGVFVQTRGGLRVSYTPRPEQPALPDLHAGDEVSVLTQAKRPQGFHDDGVFNRRAYLSAQNIDLTASLRAASLLERVRPGPLTPAVVCRDWLHWWIGTTLAGAGLSLAI